MILLCLDRPGMRVSMLIMLTILAVKYGRDVDCMLRVAPVDEDVFLLKNVIQRLVGEGSLLSLNRETNSQLRRNVLQKCAAEVSCIEVILYTVARKPIVLENQV